MEGIVKDKVAFFAMGVGTGILIAQIFTSALAAEPDKERQLAAMPTLVDQRNDAMNMAALCGGDLMTAKSEIAKLKSEMEKLKNPPESKEDPK